MFRKWTSLANPIQAFGWKTGLSLWSQLMMEKVGKWFEVVFYKWSILHIFMAFLLGRALILQELSPFAVPYFAVMYYIRRDKVVPIGLALVIGASVNSAQIGLLTFSSLLLTALALKIMVPRSRVDMSYAPFLVFGTVFVSHVIYDYYLGKWGFYDLFMNGIEALLSSVLTLIFVQSLPIITFKKKHYQLKNEEIVCLVILLASVMTGTVGWYIEGISVEHVLSRLLVLILAAVGGGAIGATVGVVTGLILSLANIDAMYQMSLLAFSGLLAGLLKDGGKMGTAVGLMIGSSILSVYAGQQGEMIVSTQESVAAVLLFLLTPRSLLNEIARFIPGTQEHQAYQQNYLHNVRNITVQKVNKFAAVFDQLARSFTEFTPSTHQEQKIDLILSEVTEQTCQKCWKKDQCWDREFLDTYESMSSMISTLERKGKLNKQDIPDSFKKRCIKIDKVTQVMAQEIKRYHYHQQLKRQILEARRLVGEQLSGVARVMGDFSREIMMEEEETDLQEQQIVEALESLGLSVRNIDIVNLREGNVDIRVSQPLAFGVEECVKIIAPLLSNLLGETIQVKGMENEVFDDGYCTVFLGSASQFEVISGVASAAKGGKLLSGDNFKIMELDNRKVALAVSDGMGNGERAHMESMAALELLQQLLQTGLDQEVALKSVNSVLSLRSTDEVFATVDLAMIDLFSLQTQFIKCGSIPSFIKRGSQVINITGNNLPMGIIQEIEVDIISRQLQEGDLLIMMTDGIYDAPRDVENKERWMKRIIMELETDDPQEVADCLLEKVIRYQYGEIEDDMTVLVARIDRNVPEWSNIVVPGFEQLQRPRTVS